MRHIKLLFLAFTLGILVNNIPGCCGYRILGIFPLNVRSHMIMFEPLMKELARRGHRVDVINTFPQKRPFPNYTDIIVPSSLNFPNNVSYSLMQKVEPDPFHFFMSMCGNKVCEEGLNNPQIQRLIKSPPIKDPYDLVIVELYAANCYLAFGRHLKVPVIGVSSSSQFPWGNDFVANPENFALESYNPIAHIDGMHLWNKLCIITHYVFIKYLFNTYTSVQSQMIKKHFGSDTPDIRKVERDLALILINSHHSVNGAKPTTPAFIEVGGLHIQDNDSEIPTEHKQWLDESKDGFIYFTFGSMVNIETFPKHLLEVFYASFSKIAPVRVFMKVSNPEKLPPGLPKNIRTFNWIPQLKVMRHSHIRAFITHGGLMGTQEAISCAVPMIGLPLFSDQSLNIHLYVQKKIALYLDYRQLTEAKLNTALNEVLNNPIYRDTVQQISKKFFDRRLSPLDEACYWVEYIIRHGEKVLRSPALELSWWQIALLDVYLTLIIIGVATTYIIILLIRLILNMVNRHPSKYSYSKKYN